MSKIVRRSLTQPIPPQPPLHYENILILKIIKKHTQQTKTSFCLINANTLRSSQQLPSAGQYALMTSLELGKVRARVRSIPPLNVIFESCQQLVLELNRAGLSYANQRCCNISIFENGFFGKARKSNTLTLFIGVQH